MDRRIEITGERGQQLFAQDLGPNIRTVYVAEYASFNLPPK